MKQNPFSFYDFIGYLIPGILGVSLCYFVMVSKSSNTILTFQEFADSIPQFSIQANILLLIIAYTIGHFMSFFSSITVEKYAIWKYDYPSKFLLKIQKVKFREHFRTFHGAFWGVVIIFILLPTVFLDFILGYVFRFKTFYSKCLDDNLISFIKLKILKLASVLGFDIQNTDIAEHKSDFFRIVFHYAFENTTNHQSKFTNYVALYGFLRTITLILNLFFLYLLIHLTLVDYFTFWSITSLILISLVSYVFFMAFMKFYRRYSLEGLMVLAINNKLN